MRSDCGQLRGTMARISSSSAAIVPPPGNDLVGKGIDHGVKNECQDDPP